MKGPPRQVWPDRTHRDEEEPLDQQQLLLLQPWWLREHEGEVVILESILG